MDMNYSRTYALMDGENFGRSDSIDGANFSTNFAMTFLNSSLGVCCTTEFIFENRLDIL